MIRNSTMLRSSPTGMSLCTTLTVQRIPLRFWNSSTSHSTPGRIPRSSAAGRKAVATSLTTWMMASTRPFNSCTCSLIWGVASPNFRVKRERSILSAVRAWPSSSWISRAIWARSPSRTESWCADSSRSNSCCSKRFLGVLSLGDVYPLEQDELPVLEVDQGRRKEYVAHFSVLAPQANFATVHHFVSLQIRDEALTAFRIGIEAHRDGAVADHLLAGIAAKPLAGGIHQDERPVLDARNGDRLRARFDHLREARLRFSQRSAFFPYFAQASEKAFRDKMGCEGDDEENKADSDQVPDVGE